jgi:hypothetical protein
MNIANSPETAEFRAGENSSGIDASLDEIRQMTELCLSHIESSSKLLAEMAALKKGSPG